MAHTITKITNIEGLSEQYITELYETFHGRYLSYAGSKAKMAFLKLIQKHVDLNIQHERVTKSFNFLLLHDKMKIIITLAKTDNGVKVVEFRVKKRTLISEEKESASYREKAKNDIEKHQDMRRLFIAKRSIDSGDLTEEEITKQQKAMWEIFNKYFPKTFSKDARTKYFHYKDNTLKVTLLEDKTKNPPDNKFVKVIEWKKREVSPDQLKYEKYLDTFDLDALETYDKEMQDMINAYNTWKESIEKRKIMQTRFETLSAPFYNIEIHEKTVYVFFQKKYIYILTAKPLKNRDKGISFVITRNLR